MKGWMRSSLLVLAGAFLVVTSAGCPPSYPKCATDDHCKSHNEVCVAGFCKQCRDDSQCNSAANPQPCIQCTTDRTCQKRSRCCMSDAECPGEKCWPRQNAAGADLPMPGKCGDKCLRVTCPEGQKCKDGACVPDVECVDDGGCPPNHRCVNNECVPGCKVAAVYFDYNEYSIKLSMESVIQENADCIKSKGGSYTVEGHCDERGDAEYNLALGQRRAAAVKKQYVNLGVAKGNLSTVSYGKERPVCHEHGEECWQQNRRAESVEK